MREEEIVTREHSILADKRVTRLATHSEPDIHAHVDSRAGCVEDNSYYFSAADDVATGEEQQPQRRSAENNGDPQVNASLRHRCLRQRGTAVDAGATIDHARGIGHLPGGKAREKNGAHQAHQKVRSCMARRWAATSHCRWRETMNTSDEAKTSEAAVTTKKELVGAAKESARGVLNGSLSRLHC